MSSGDPYGYGSTGHNYGQQYPQQGGHPGQQGGYPGQQGGYPGPYGSQGNYGQPQQYGQSQAQGYYQQNQSYPGGPPVSGHGPQDHTYQNYQNYQNAPPAAYNGPPPAQQPTGRDQSNWGQGPNISNQYHQGTSTAPQASSQKDGDTRGLSTKFSSLMSRKSKSKESSSSSDSSDDDKKKKKKDKKKKKKSEDYATVPNFSSRDGPYPFSLYCARDNPEVIVLAVADGGDDRDLLVGPNQDKKHPAYEILYDDQADFEVNRFEMPDLNPKKGVFAGKCEMRNNADNPASTRYCFPWLDWDMSVEADWWASDAGLLQGKSYMKWVLLNSVNTHRTGKFAVRLFDTSTDTAPTVATFYVDSYIDGVTEGRLEIVARLMRTYEQLDEMVVVALGVMDYHRKNIWDNIPED